MADELLISYTTTFTTSINLTTTHYTYTPYYPSLTNHTTTTTIQTTSTIPSPNLSLTPTQTYPFHTTTYLTHYTNTNSFPFPTHGPAAK